MESDEPIDDIARLAPAALAPARARVRVSVGAAIVLLIAALVTAVIVSAVSGQGGSRTVVPPGASVGGGAGGGVGQAEPSRPTGVAAAPGALIFVHVLGAVRRPGLFELHDGARVIDVVAAAGGLDAQADPAGVNLARLVGDGEQLYIPRLGEVQPGAPPVAGGGVTGSGDRNGVVQGGKINLNTASAAELETLPRIGPALARRIIDYREANGRFSNVDDLRNVTGIGGKTFEGLKELIMV